MAKKFVYAANAAGRKEYAKVLARIQAEGICPFCEPYFLKYHTRPILKKGKYWIVTENMNPYAGTKMHLLLVHRGHIENPAKLSASALTELGKHLAWAYKEFKLPGGALFMRFGDGRYTGASVAHLHANILSGTRSGKKTIPIAVTLGHKRT